MAEWAGAYASPRPSMASIYQSDYSQQVRQHEQGLSDGRWRAAASPMASGVVPSPAYSSMFASANEEQPLANTVQSLTGAAVPVEQFTFNNMVPFFKGSVTQNTDVERGNRSLLENFTGQGERFVHKQEQDVFFSPTAAVGWATGAPNTNDFEKSRVVLPKAQRNFFPLAQQYVAPGLNAGYSALGEGGRQQMSTLDFARPKNVDQLRAANDPKSVYEQPIAAPPRYGAKAPTLGQLGAVEKNKPDTAFEQRPEQWLHTTGAFQKPAHQPVQPLKPTARADVQAYKGAAHGAQTRAGDYGKASICVYDNARRTTQTRTRVSNLRSLVNAVVAPLLDMLRANPKEYAIEAGRTFGNMHAQVPEKATLYDPVNHVMKTTIKETIVHDTDVSNLHGRERGTMPFDDAARTTTKETTPTLDTVRNVSARTYRVTVYNTEEVARRTQREMLENAANQAGYMGKGALSKAGAYVSTDVEMPLTQKQFVSDSPHTGGAGAQGEYRPQSHEAADNMEVDGTREMLLTKAGYTPNAAGANAGIDGKDVNLDVRKLVGDAFAARAFGNSAPLNASGTAPLAACELTKQPTPLADYSAERLDPSMLASLKSNPYQININPIADA